MKLSNYPILKLLIPYTIGILLSCFVLNPKLLAQNCLIIIIVELALMIAVIGLSFVHKYHWQSIKAILLAIVFVFLGALTPQWRLRKSFNNTEQNILKENQYLIVRIIDFPTERAKSIKTLVEIWQTADGRFMKGKALLYLAKSPEAFALNYGDILCVRTNITEIAGPKNPDAFDNQQYMARRGIFHSGYVRENAWTKLDNKPASRLKAISGKWQDKLTGIFAQAGLSGGEYSVITAILLGDDDTMEPELKASYAAAGVSHILCVSGMHVGIIYMILNFLFKPMDLFRTSKIIKSLILLLLIWLYANITGLSPSVTRSAAMFTFVTVGTLLHRRTDIFHSLFTSLFILLIINPLLLFEVGFQLSYLAVFGIVILQKYLVKIYTCKTRIGLYFWELATVSIAAQIGTFPISIYYFGQFPNYFILSNMAVMALSFVIMLTGITLLATSFIKFLVPIISWLLTHEIRWMNSIILFVKELPGSVTQNIDYSFLQVLLLYTFIIILFLTITRRKKQLAWVSCVIFILFSGCFVIKKWRIEHHESVIVYSIRRTAAIGFEYHGESIIFSDSILDRENKNYRYAIQNHEVKQHLQSELIPIDTPYFENEFVVKQGDFIRFSDKEYYILKRKNRLHEVDLSPKIDILLLQHNPVMKPEEVHRIISFDEVIADESNTAFYINRWQNYCKTNGIKFRYTGN